MLTQLCQCLDVSPKHCTRSNRAERCEMAWLDTTSVVDSKMEKTLEAVFQKRTHCTSMLGADLAGGRLGWWHVMIDHRDKSEG